MLASIVALTALASAPVEFAPQVESAPPAGSTAPSEPTAPMLEQPLAVDWRASEGCPTRGELLERLHRLHPELPAPQTIADDPNAGLRVSGTIEASEVDTRMTWTASLRFEGPRGVDERSFAGADCSALTDAAALVIAVALDPVLTSQRITIIEGRSPPVDQALADQPPRERPKAAAPSEAQPPVPPRVRSSRADNLVPARETSELRGSVGLLAGGGFGPIRAGFANVGGELSVFGPWWRASLLGLWQAPRTLAHALGEVRYDGFIVGARGCGVPSLDALEFPVCAGIEAGIIRGRGTGATPEPREASVPAVALSLGAGLRWVLRDRVAIGLRLEIPISLVRGGFSIDDAVVQELTPVGVRGLAGVELRFP